MKVPFAKILNTHGLKGEVKVSPLVLSSELIFQIEKFYLSEASYEELWVESIKKGPGFNVFIVKFKDIDYEKAKTLTNQKLYVSLEDLPQPLEDEFYYYQIEGFSVKDLSGKVWGKVKEVMPMGEYDLLLVKTKEGFEFYVPLVGEYVIELDFSNQSILVQNIEDLVEAQKP
ncbi:ribosome maturation factor RimM [Thermodesulfobacterium sp. TA1]|uniref:ribosome maturation factor RimM n=1 Tax=Thermodesulfobacterium sp. TA1 TaxID=2234087 RepID=UPI00143DC9D8|nr:ribosome maturation factor RimM [Thermodesulfobacterium sp. TA1]